MRLLGAAMIISAFGGAGLAAALELEKRFRLLREAERITEHMRTEVCLRRRPLPEVLSALSEAFPRRFAGADRLERQLAEISFAELWRACIKKNTFPPEAETALIRLGEELTLGEPPERVFSRCQDDLGRLREQTREQKEKNARLYPAAGLALGCLLVIVLL